MSRTIEEFDVPVLMLLGNDWEARLTVEATEWGWQIVRVELGATWTGKEMTRFAKAAEVNLATLSADEWTHLERVVRDTFDGDI